MLALNTAHIRTIRVGLIDLSLFRLFELGNDMLYSAFQLLS